MFEQIGRYARTGFCILAGAVAALAAFLVAVEGLQLVLQLIHAGLNALVQNTPQ